MANEDDETLVAGLTGTPEEPPLRGVAQVPDIAATTRIPTPDRVMTPVFVDETGRRGRWLGVLGLVLAVIALLLLAALWWSQVTATRA